MHVKKESSQIFAQITTKSHSCLSLVPLYSDDEIFRLLLKGGRATSRNIVMPDIELLHQVAVKTVRMFVNSFAFDQKNMKSSKMNIQTLVSSEQTITSTLSPSHLLHTLAKINKMDEGKVGTKSLLGGAEANGFDTNTIILAVNLMILCALTAILYVLASIALNLGGGRLGDVLASAIGATVTAREILPAPLRA
uniref:Uncharacterized protein n=1 Tax=Globodera rostochiensis TaxID=31243 RepID=A0A914I0M1_GLORO